MALLFFSNFEDSFDSIYPVITPSESGTVLLSANHTCGSKSVSLQAIETPYASASLIYANAVTLAQQGTISFYVYIPTGNGGTVSNAIIDVYDMSIVKFGIRIFFEWVAPGFYSVSIVYYDEDANILDSLIGLVFTGAWTHIECSWDYDTGAVELYVDGTKNDSGSFPADTINSDSLDVRLFHGGFALPYYLDDFAIHDVVLHTSAFTPSCFSYSSFSPGLTFGYAFGMKGFTR